MRVAFEQLRPEMALAADIVDGGGRLLLPKGTVLTDKHLRYCQMWGIPEAEIQGNEVAELETPGIDPQALAASEAKLRPRFRHVDLSHPVMAELFHHSAETAARHPA